MVEGNGIRLDKCNGLSRMDWQRITISSRFQFVQKIYSIFYDDVFRCTPESSSCVLSSVNAKLYWN